MSNSDRYYEVLNLIGSTNEELYDMIEKTIHMKDAYTREIEFELYALNGGTGEGSLERYLDLKKKYNKLCALQDEMEKIMIDF